MGLESRHDRSTPQPGAQRTVRKKKPGCCGQDDRFVLASDVTRMLAIVGNIAALRNLLVAEGDEWVDAECAARGNVAGQERDSDENERDGHKGPRVGGAYVIEQAAKRAG
jgi:hypothetical protein